MASLTKILDWFGFGSGNYAGGDGHSEKGGHGHTHGVIDSSITTTDRGIWALKWSFVILGITAALQLVVVFVSGSVALLADTIHNLGDAGTAIPLWVAFALARRKPSKTFTYGLGRAEDLAGILIVAIILFSALFAGYQAIDRLLHPQAITALGWVVAAGIVGFIGNETVAVFRIRVGRQMNSAALIADGYHARTDGITSLAVVAGAIGVWLGFPLADPIVGLLITVAIFGIVWQSVRAVFTRTLDGVDPGITEEIRHAVEHVPGVTGVMDAKARWSGHRMHADVELAANESLTLAQANDLARSVQRALVEHLPALSRANISFVTADLASVIQSASANPQGHHAPQPFRFELKWAAGVVEIVDTPSGERMRLTLDRETSSLTARVEINRPAGKVEILKLERESATANIFQSSAAPVEPHAFDARLFLESKGQHEILSFEMTEPVGHHH